MKFNELQLSKEMLRAIQDCGYNEATYIQSACIPVLLTGGDILGQSQTGTGKTAAFGIPLIELSEVSKHKRPQALILTPTRELALQVVEEIRKFAKYKEGLRTVCLYGGSPIQKQIQDMKKGCDIVVGCPGRVLDHLRRHTLKMENCNKLVLDEADEMLNMGFREDIEAIIKELPDERQTILFSATMPKAILDITKQYQTNPVHIKTPSTELTVAKIEQVVYECKQSDKREVLIQLIELQRPTLAMVFCNTKKMVDDLTSDLVAKGYPAAAIHGDMKQEARANVMERFKSKKINILVATDVAARGIDVDSMDVVYNFDFPQEAEYYVHRIGRTGRAGKEGLAVTLLTPRQRGLVRDLERTTKAKIESKPLPNQKMIREIRSNQVKEDIKNMLNESVSKEIEDLINEFSTQGFSDKELALALANNMFASSLLQEIKLPEKEPNSLRVQSKDKATIEINVGHRHKVSPAHLLSAIAEATGLSGKDIGKINISDRTSTVDVPKEVIKEILKDLKNATIKGYAIEVNQVSSKSKDRSDTRSSDRKPRSDSRGYDRKPRTDSRSDRKPRSDSKKSEFKSDKKESKPRRERSRKED
ncbi:DEAD/DEAH box helicase [Anaerorhabdus furcosa]|uniref:ATP-dependent RNA helicase CshA n=1 Tax=Anaerorhabdus furcosa TaxID=118967 RepID=A0A1T4QD46_9FIRM|nr:DEAD/DEAH box helicase [Anaerorhabdus furcosa]SKA01614.1 ATP-dependent RNA helicase DeaD [Anaerorhabdus furcosa]